MKIYENTKGFYSMKKINRCFFLYRCCYDTDFTKFSTKTHQDFGEKVINHQVFYPETEKTHLMACQLESVAILCYYFQGKHGDFLWDSYWHRKTQVITSCWLWFMIHKPSASYLKQVALHTIKQNEQKEEIFLFCFSTPAKKQQRSVVSRSFTENNRSWRLTDWWTW